MSDDANIKGEWQDWPLEPMRILRELEYYKVRYVVIGGLAAAIHGSPLPTYDLDITPSDDRRNRERLLQTLEALDSGLLSEDRVLSVDSPEAQKLLHCCTSCSLYTPFGMLDLEFYPSGTHGYRDLQRAATRILLGEDLEVPVAALADVIRSKETAHRERDIADLVALRATLELSNT